MYNVFNRLPIFLPDIIIECSLQINPENHDVQFPPPKLKEEQNTFQNVVVCMFDMFVF